MNLANKSFKNNRTGEIVKVIDSFENIAVLENKQKIDTRNLMDINQWTEQIDPANFFNNQNAYNILAEKIKNIPTSNLKDEDGSTPVSVSTYDSDFRPASNESAIVMTNEDDEKAELARKYGATIDNNDALSKQQEAFAKILQEDKDEVTIVKQPQIVRKIEQPKQAQAKVENTNLSVEDPIITMFKKTKRNVDFNISVDITDRIPRLDFIEMMEDSYEISMIDFLADEFTNKIIQDPSIIRDKIKNKINELVYNKSKSDVNPQITDSVTQTKLKRDTSFNEDTGEVEVEKSKNTKKPKPNTAQGEKPGYKSPRKKESTEK